MAIDESLSQLSTNLVYSAMAVYAGAMVSFAAEWAFGARGVLGQTLPAVSARAGAGAGSVGESGGAFRASSGNGEEVKTRENLADRLGGVAVSLTVLAFGLHLAGVVFRAASAGRAPWGNMYEFAIGSALAATGVFLALLTRFDARRLGIFVVTPVLLILGLAVTVLHTDAGPLTPALQSYWLGIHVTAAVLSAGGFTVGAVATALFLYAERHAARHNGRLPARLPSAETLDQLAYRVFAFVFPLWTFAIMAGAIWAERAWSRYWGWDPKETWSFITWVLFAAYLHARATAGWRGRRAALVALAGYACLLFNFVGVNIWLTGFHSYAGV